MEPSPFAGAGLGLPGFEEEGVSRPLDSHWPNHAGLHDTRQGWGSALGACAEPPRPSPPLLLRRRHDATPALVLTSITSPVPTCHLPASSEPPPTLQELALGAELTRPGATLLGQRGATAATTSGRAPAAPCHVDSVGAAAPPLIRLQPLRHCRAARPHPAARASQHSREQRQHQQRCQRQQRQRPPGCRVFLGCTRLRQPGSRG